MNLTYSTNYQIVQANSNFSLLQIWHNYMNVQPMNCIVQPTEYVGGIWQGNVQSARDVGQLHKTGISCVVTVASTTGITYSQKDQIIQKQYSVSDVTSFDISRYFLDAAEFIEEMRYDGHNVLVHCNAGVSRSSTMIIAYLMLKEGYTLEKALDLCKKNRPITRPNPGFVRQLINLQKFINQQKKIIQEEQNEQMNEQMKLQKMNINTEKQKHINDEDLENIEFQNSVLNKKRISTCKSSVSGTVKIGNFDFQQYNEEDEEDDLQDDLQKYGKSTGFVQNQRFLYSNTKKFRESITVGYSTKPRIIGARESLLVKKDRIIPSQTHYYTVHGKLAQNPLQNNNKILSNANRFQTKYKLLSSTTPRTAQQKYEQEQIYIQNKSDEIIQPKFGDIPDETEQNNVVNEQEQEKQNEKLQKEKSKSKEKQKENETEKQRKPKSNRRLSNKTERNNNNSKKIYNKENEKKKQQEKRLSEEELKAQEEFKKNIKRKLMNMELRQSRFKKERLQQEDYDKNFRTKLTFQKNFYSLEKLPANKMIPITFTDQEKQLYSSGKDFGYKSLRDNLNTTQGGSAYGNYRDKYLDSTQLLQTGFSKYQTDSSFFYSARNKQQQQSSQQFNKQQLKTQYSLYSSPLKIENQLSQIYSADHPIHSNFQNISSQSGAPYQGYYYKQQQSAFDKEEKNLPVLNSNQADLHRKSILTYQVKTTDQKKDSFYVHKPINNQSMQENTRRNMLQSSSTILYRQSTKSPTNNKSQFKV